MRAGSTLYLSLVIDPALHRYDAPDVSGVFRALRSRQRILVHTTDIPGAAA